MILKRFYLTRLAAVDMHTAQHIVAKCLSGFLTADRTIVLVTHHVSLCLPVATYIIELSYGKTVMNDFMKTLRDDGLLEAAVQREHASVIENVDEKEPTDVLANEADALGNTVRRTTTGIKRSGKLIEVEARAEGRVSARTYMTYIRAAGTFCWIFSVLLMILIRFINIASQVMLS